MKERKDKRMKPGKTAARVLEATKWYQANDYTPNYEEIAEKSGVSVRVVPDYLRELAQQGFLRPKDKRTSNQP